MSKSNRKIELGAETRAELIKTARRLFADGYDAVGTPAIAKAAGVTRGALYHHFPDKRALFSAVVEQIARDMVDHIEEAADVPDDDPVSAVLAGCRAFVSACQSAETRQILLLDAPAVLGWLAWRDIDARNGFGSLKEGLLVCAEAGHIAEVDIDTAAFLISGALNEAVFAMAYAKEDNLSDKHFGVCIERMVRGLLDEKHRHKV